MAHSRISSAYARTQCWSFVFYVRLVFRAAFNKCTRRLACAGTAIFHGDQATNDTVCDFLFVYLEHTHIFYGRGILKCIIICIWWTHQTESDKCCQPSARHWFAIAYEHWAHIEMSFNSPHVKHKQQLKLPSNCINLKVFGAYHEHLYRRNYKIVQNIAVMKWLLENNMNLNLLS